LNYLIVHCPPLALFDTQYCGPYARLYDDDDDDVCSPVKYMVTCGTCHCGLLLTPIKLVTLDGFLPLICYEGSVTVGIPQSVWQIGYGLGDRAGGIRFPVGTRYFSLLHNVQAGSGLHPASYPMGTASFFPGRKAAGA
jgi:hypothetical protein